jgi:hypothetical protein
MRLSRVALVVASEIRLTGDQTLPRDPRSIVERLAVILHPERVAAIASVDERTINNWIEGYGTPSLDADVALRLADDVVLQLIDRMSPDAVYGWFGGQNPRLGGRAPALVIRQSAADANVREAVLNAAASFLVD